jgi:hypothetical protein
MFWNKKKEVVKVDPVLEKLDMLTNILVDVNTRLSVLEQEAVVAAQEAVVAAQEAVVAAQAAEVVEASEPLVTLTGSDIDSDGKVKIALDWNDGFIDQLRASGYQGTTDEVVVQKWLVHLANDINEKLTHTSSTFS